jgi:tetratricopeptide (TPR) repeat protein
MNTEPNISGLLQKAYEYLKASDIGSAQKTLDQALELDFENPELIYALKCVKWWQERLDRLNGFHNNLDKGRYILTQWRSFYAFLDRIGGSFDRCLYVMRHFVFSFALVFFEDILGEKVNQHDPGLLLQVGRCYKGVGQYELALKYLEQAARFKRDDGETLSELADVNALMDASREAKALFREAFYVDPQGIDQRAMESELFIRLRDRVKELGMPEPELLEWIPIYGNIYGVFSVKRKLSPLELARLKQSIFTLENEVRSRSGNITLLKPRLINRYLWLIDYFENVREDPQQIEDTMNRIKIIDPGIYEQIR